MARVTVPMASKALGLRQINPSDVQASDSLIQALSLLLGYMDGNRVPISCTPTGMLSTGSPALADVVHFTAAGASEAKQGDDIPCSEVLCMAHPDNNGRIWVRSREAAASNNAFPLEAKEGVGFTIHNMSKLYALIETAGDTLIVGYAV